MLIIRFTKRPDGAVVLKCVRADGSTTWQRVDDNHAAFFPLHDLTHYAVETELAFRRGFFGLLAEGWDIAETTGKTGRGPLPNEALEVEYLVSAFAAERAGRESFGRGIQSAVLNVRSRKRDAVASRAFGHGSGASSLALQGARDTMASAAAR